MNLNVLFDVPAQVAQGLANGSLERVGGVVRDTSSKQVVMWLQEGGSGISKSIGTPSLAGGARAAAAANPLLSTANLGVSVIGFALVLQSSTASAIRSEHWKPRSIESAINLMTLHWQS